MDVVPLIMNYIRTEMRSRRTPGLTIPQFRTLIFLYRHEDASLSQVAEHVGLKLPTMSKTVDTLVSRKLIIRSDYPEDRRRVSLKLTTNGLEELKRTRHSAETQISAVIAGLSPEQRAGIAASLKALRTLFAGQKQPKSEEYRTDAPEE
jgi:DNA-binding MarR family transcriptional regulator